MFKLPKKWLYTLLFIIILGLSYFFMFKHTSPVVYAVPTNVSFGSLGVCAGCGICNCSMTTDNPYKQLALTQVKFTTQADAPSVVTLSFSRNAAITNQPGLAQYLAADATTFPFPVAFPLSNDLCAALHLPTGTVVTPTTPNVLKIDGDNVTITITFPAAPPKYATLNVMFGNQNVNAACDNGKQGICSFTSGPNTSAAGVTDNDIAVTFMNDPNNPQGLLLTFSFTALSSMQRLQAQIFKPAVNGPITYTFSAMLPLTDPAFAALALQGQNPNIQAGAQGKATMAGDLITIALPYVPQ